MRKFLTPFLGLIILGLTACGGGGGNNPQPQGVPSFPSHPMASDFQFIQDFQLILDRFGVTQVYTDTATSPAWLQAEYVYDGQVDDSDYFPDLIGSTTQGDLTLFDQQGDEVHVDLLSDTLGFLQARKAHLHGSANWFCVAWAYDEEFGDDSGHTVVQTNIIVMNGVLTPTGDLEVRLCWLAVSWHDINGFVLHEVNGIPTEDVAGSIHLESWTAWLAGLLP